MILYVFVQNDCLYSNYDAFFTCCEATVNVDCTAVCIYQNLL